MCYQGNHCACAGLYSAGTNYHEVQNTKGGLIIAVGAADNWYTLYCSKRFSIRRSLRFLLRPVKLCVGDRLSADNWQPTLLAMEKTTVLCAVSRHITLLVLLVGKKKVNACLFPSLVATTSVWLLKYEVCYINCMYKLWSLLGLQCIIMTFEKLGILIKRVVPWHPKNPLWIRHCACYIVYTLVRHDRNIYSTLPTTDY